jgi:hypothetical protein
MSDEKKKTIRSLGMMHVVHENVVGGSSMIGFPLVISVPEKRSDQ